MRKNDRQTLYSIIGFFGGLLFMNVITSHNVAYRTFFLILGGVLVGWVGYKIATR